MARPRKWTDEQLAIELPRAQSWNSLCLALGLKNPSGHTFARVNAAIERLGLSTDHFLGKAWNLGRGSGRDPEAQRRASLRWYEANRDRQIQKITAKRMERLQIVRERKKRPCQDCDKRYPYFVMDLDHREGVEKLFNLSSSQAQSASEEKFLAELEKCDVVCANCHRLRTAARAGWGDDAPVEEVSLLRQDT